MKSIIYCLLFHKGPIAELAESCLRFTPKIALRENEAIFLHFQEAAATVPPSWTTLSPRIANLCKRFLCGPPKVGIATSPGVALALARFEATDHSHLPLAALADIAHPFQSADPELQLRISEMLSLLERLGLRTLHDLSVIPPRSLASRFGKDGATLIRRLLRPDDAVWPRFHPPERWIERADLQDTETQTSCVSSEALLFLIRGMLDRLCTRLRGRGLRAAAILIRLKLEDRSARELELELSVPQGSAAAILLILRDRLDGELLRRPLRAQVTFLQLEITEIAPGRGAQRDFLDKREEEAEAWDALLARMRQKLGKNAVFAARLADRHLPEASWRPVDAVSAFVGNTDNASIESLKELELVRRPSRLLKQPKRLAGPPETIWQIIDRVGPERISGEWWHEPFDRDYYRLTTASGDLLWVFKSQGDFFLHGYFD